VRRRLPAGVDEEYFTGPLDFRSLYWVSAEQRMAVSIREVELAAWRRSRRRPCDESIDYTTVAFEDGKAKFLNLTGKVVNVSKTGLCFLTKYPLKAGHVLEFKKRVFHYSHGVVIWIRKLGGLYLNGTRFIG